MEGSCWRDKRNNSCRFAKASPSVSIEWRDPNKITHSLHQLVSQQVYQIGGGYEDANDSNRLRHDPIYQVACDRLPLPDAEHLASQPTMTRLENHVGKREVSKMRSRMVESLYCAIPTAPGGNCAEP